MRLDLEAVNAQWLTNVSQWLLQQDELRDLKKTFELAQHHIAELERLPNQLSYKEAEVRRLQHELHVTNDMYKRVCDELDSRTRHNTNTKVEVKETLQTPRYYEYDNHRRCLYRDYERSPSRSITPDAEKQCEHWLDAKDSRYRRLTLPDEEIVPTQRRVSSPQRHIKRA